MSTPHNKPEKVKAKPKFTMQEVKSSSVSHIGHVGDTLRVRFVSGLTYDYPGVTAKDFDALRTAESIGKHFAVHIRSKLTGIPVGDRVVPYAVSHK